MGFAATTRTSISLAEIWTFDQSKEVLFSLINFSKCPVYNTHLIRIEMLRIFASIGKLFFVCENIVFIDSIFPVLILFYLRIFAIDCFLAVLKWLFVFSWFVSSPDLKCTAKLLANHVIWPKCAKYVLSGTMIYADTFCCSVLWMFQTTRTFPIQTSQYHTKKKNLMQIMHKANKIHFPIGAYFTVE